ncbi:MAG: carboxypeptidase-like regulatory domain-containing protein [Gemmatimonadetes bacterium]|nr:carboxypeptidase-like regulatory domain-containing protein [Gemmatimonadota bacterium]
MTMRWVWFFAVLLLATQVQAKVIQGTVTDASTGEPLPAATVHVLGTYDGTISNTEGKYVLSLRFLPAVVEVRYIGYRSQQYHVTEDAADVRDFALEPVPIELETLVVTAEDMGPNIMRKVIAQKQTWWDSLETFRVEAYSRFVLHKDTAIVAIVESLSDGFWDKKKGWREVVKDKRETENLDLDFALPAAAGVNLYDDETVLVGHRLIGVTHPDALDHYDFVLTGRRKMDDRIIYDIDVKPKHSLKTAFNGRVAVLDSVYALVEVELTPNRAFLFPPPVREFTITMRQQFSNFGGDYYLPVGYQSDVNVEVGMIGLQFPPFKRQRVSRLTGYEVNVALPDSLYDQDRIVVDSVRVEQDSLLVQTALAVPLDDIEQEAYARIDSTMTLDKAYEPKGFLARFVKDDEEKEKSEKNSKDGEKKRKLPFRVDPDIWFNRVDGGHLGSKISAGSSQSRAAFEGGGAYNFGLKRWSLNGKATVRWGASNRGFVSLEGFRGTDTRHRSRLYSRYEVSLRQIRGLEDYFDFFWREGVRGTAGYRFGRPRRAGVRLSGGINVAQHSSVEKTTDWHFSGDIDVQRPNPEIDPGNLRSVFLRADIEGKNLGPALIFGKRKIALEVEHSRSGFGSDFTQVRVLLDWRIETMFKRRLLPNVLDVRVVGSAFTGTLPRQCFEILDLGVLLSRVSIFGGFRTRVDRPYEGEKVLGMFWEHNFRTVPFELIGWRWAAERNIGLIVHGGHGRTWFGDLTLLDYAPQYTDGFHHELGVSINGLFNLFRLDFTKRLDAPGFFVSVGFVRF